MADTAIEWATKVWNPTTGCDRVTPGCDHCYALTMAKRLKGMGSTKYQTDGDPRTSGPGFGLAIHEDTLGIPLGWRKPQRIFVNSMSDLFHADVPDEFIARVWAVMASAPRHTFQVLTKRHGRMRSLLSSEEFRLAVQRRIPHAGASPYAAAYWKTWPLPNVWLGVSVEDQKRADLRIPALLDTPAAVRWLSCEPLLGSVDLDTQPWRPIGRDLPQIDWVVVGGESGPGARPMHPAWARTLRDQCQVAGIPFLFKQWGEYAPIPQVTGPDLIERVGKRAAGRVLDGRTWDEYPAAADG